MVSDPAASVRVKTIAVTHIRRDLGRSDLLRSSLAAVCLETRLLLKWYVAHGQLWVAVTCSVYTMPQVSLPCHLAEGCWPAGHQTLQRHGRGWGIACSHGRAGEFELVTD